LIVICASLVLAVALTSDLVRLPLAARASLPLLFVAAVAVAAGRTEMDRRIINSVLRRR
jgi:hypothetical protein